MPEKWPKYDPSRGYWLCEPCWNYRHVSISRDPILNRLHSRSLCVTSICQCPCTGRYDGKRLKFTGEGELSFAAPLLPPISPKS
jgi:hypothetical protein